MLPLKLLLLMDRVASSGVLGESKGNRYSAWAELHPSFTCMFCFDVLLVFDGVGKGLVTGAAL